MTKKYWSGLVVCVAVFIGMCVVQEAEGTDKSPELRVWQVKRQCFAPEIEREILKQPEAGSVPRNIILIIGDGMGWGAHDLTSLYVHGETRRMVMHQFPVVGLCETYSKNSPVTDSAASGTALSSGEKTNNGRIGMTHDEIKLKSIAKFALEMGKSVAIITDDALSGATPAVFYANQPSRRMADEIIADAAASGFDILIGNGNTRKKFTENGEESKQRNLQAEMEKAGYKFIETPEEFDAVPKGAKVVGQIQSKVFTASDDLLGKVAKTAMERLAENENGFFMMVECTYPDSGGHGNNPDTSAMGVVRTDWVAKFAAEFAAKHGDTLVVCTADHETGGINVIKSAAPETKPIVVYTTKSHTGAPVPVYAFGPAAERFGGHINNIDISRSMGELWGVTLPATLDGVLLEEVIKEKALPVEAAK